MENVNAKVNEALSSIKDKLDDFVSQDEAFWMSVAMFLFGVIVGMLISPRKVKNVTRIGRRRPAYIDDECCDEECCG
ncbi:MAG: hypothetical protein LUE12_08285 [Ruminococcus sp.]|nr:hypothetical protein [Ruminococcus sp.]